MAPGGRGAGPAATTALAERDAAAVTQPQGRATARQCAGGTQDEQPQAAAPGSGSRTTKAQVGGGGGAAPPGRQSLGSASAGGRGICAGLMRGPLPVMGVVMWVPGF